MAVTAQALWYVGPGQAEIRGETLGPLASGTVRVCACHVTTVRALFHRSGNRSSAFPGGKRQGGGISHSRTWPGGIGWCRS